jgi:predicted Zn-dependent peptidase
VRLPLPDLSQSHLALGAVLADRRDDDWPALRIAALAIAGSLHSRVDAVLRERLGITYGIRAHLSPRVGDGLFDISGGVQAGAAAVAMAGLRGVLDDAASTGLTSAEVESARGYLLGAAAIGLHTPRGYAEALADAVEAGQGGDGVADSLRRLRDVTLDEVNDVVSRSLRPELLCTVVVGPPGDVQPDELGSSPPVWS